MTERAELFLGIIAVAMLTIAIVHVGAIVAAGLLARRVSRLVDQTLDTLHTTIESPLREGRALVDAFRAGLDAIRSLRQPSKDRPARAEDDEGLFI